MLTESKAFRGFFGRWHPKGEGILWPHTWGKGFGIE